MEVVSRTDTLGDNSVGESMSLRQGTHSPREPNDNYNTAQADRLVKEIYPGYMVIREDTMDIHQDTNPPDLGWEDKSKDAHPPSPNSDKKDSEDIPQAIRKALLVCNTGCMSSLLDDITQNLMAMEKRHHHYG